MNFCMKKMHDFFARISLPKKVMRKNRAEIHAGAVQGLVQKFVQKIRAEICAQTIVQKFVQKFVRKKSCKK